MLGLLGWGRTLPQQAAARSEEIPDHLLLADIESKTEPPPAPISSSANGTPCCFEKGNVSACPLIPATPTAKVRSGTPHGQIRRYVSTADHVADGRLRCAILINGGVWRLYDYRARPCVSGYHEPTWPNCFNPATKTRYARSTCCCAASPSPHRAARRSHYWKPRSPKSAASHFLLTAPLRCGPDGRAGQATGRGAEAQCQSPSLQPALLQGQQDLSASRN